MAFSFYQALRTIPSDLDEVSRHFQLSPWLRFRRLELPFAAPGLIWNTMMSMSGAWFFVVASEAIMVGDTTVKLPGIGSWIALAIEQQNIEAVVLAVVTMAVVILAYDQLVFRPIVAWADKFRFEQTAAQQRPTSWLYDLVRRARLINRVSAHVTLATSHLTYLPSIRIPDSVARSLSKRPKLGKAGDMLWLAVVLAATGYALWSVADYVRATLGPDDVLTALGYGVLTLLRVVILIAIASVIWVPIGVWIGLRPWAAERAQPIAQFLAAVPAQ